MPGRAGAAQRRARSPVTPVTKNITFNDPGSVDRRGRLKQLLTCTEAVAGSELAGAAGDPGATAGRARQWKGKGSRLGRLRRRAARAGVPR